MRLNKKGFTLIELLVTIVIIGLVVGFSTYGIIKILGNSEEEATVLSESSLREAARIYSSEVGSDSWKNANTYDAFCVTVGELMNKGLLDKKATTPDGIDRNTFIIVKRNKVTLSVEEEEIVSDIVDTENNKICTGQVTEEGEEYTLPKVSGHDSYTDKLIINFEGGSASYQGSSSTINYKCLYGESSSNINKEGKIVGNNCEIDNLKNADEDNKKIEYYVRIYMNTNHGTSVLAEDENESYTLANFIAPEITKNNWTANITYTDKDSNNHDINPAYHYFKSTINGHQM